MYCKNCGNVIDGGVGTCPSCGQNPIASSNYCSECGHFCVPGDKICVQCGKPLEMQNFNITTEPTPQPQAASADINSANPSVETKIGPKFLPSSEKYCRNCGLVIPSDSITCPFCDKQNGTNYCPKCGAGTTQYDNTCSVCASPLINLANHNTSPINNVPYIAPNNRNNYRPTNFNKKEGNCDWIVTLLLCFFLGEFGAHRFYTGHIGIGIVQFLTAGGCGIWWLVDLIMIIVGSYKDANGNDLKRD